MKKKIFILIVLLISISYLSVNAEEHKTLINIDYPSMNQSVTNSLRIQGWVMSTINTNLEVYVDDTKVENIERIKRDDVINAIKDYGDETTNPTPGFLKIHNIDTLDYGNHILKIKALDTNNNVIKEETVKFKKKNPNTLINIDYPNTKVEGESLLIQGWVMSTTNNYIKTYIDDIEVTENITRGKRSDVLKVVQGYGNESTNLTPGYKGEYDISDYEDGSYSIKIVIKDEGTKEIIKEEVRQFTIKNNKR